MSAQDYWVRQDPAKPLYEDLLWSRPENKMQAGKLLIVGGSSDNFKAINGAYIAAKQAGVGACKVYLPDSLEKALSNVLDDGFYGPSNLSGGFSRQALGQLLDLSVWADGVLLAGEFGKNSETTVFIESFLDKYKGLLVLANDSIDLILNQMDQIIFRPKTILVADLSRLQKAGLASKLSIAFKSTSGLMQLIQALHELTARVNLAVLTYHLNSYVVSFSGQVSSTKTPSEIDWQTSSAAKAAVWSIQNSNNLFKAVTTSII